mmetsp:Transcript_1405/g.1607  ORF Transcript_1405/g.1607 Transcript_1405/m.1607 type:complete len:92 (+) Transcript_1405:223-498(+)
MHFVFQLSSVLDSKKMPRKKARCTSPKWRMQQLCRKLIIFKVVSKSARTLGPKCLFWLVVQTLVFEMIKKLFLVSHVKQSCSSVIDRFQDV